jgi:glycosyltransferase involved in cell wall biosynthesis
METIKPLISVILPAYNEEAILLSNVGKIVDHLDHNVEYNWEVLIINDGSSDNTGKIADEIEKTNKQVRVIHHPSNLNLGQALQTGFRNAKGEIIVVLDIDLSYAVENIEILANKLVAESADIVIASPYMKGGIVTAVPFLRRILSKWVNKFMQMSSQDNYHTFTGMVRAYRTSFIQSVNLKTRDYEINPEIIYKAMILRAKIVEVPANLDWTEQNKYAGKRTSGMRLLRGFFSGLMSAFIFRPYIFFLGIGTILMCLSLYQLIWLFIDTISFWRTLLVQGTQMDYPFSFSLATQFDKNPQSFLVGGITFLAAIQFLGLGFLSLQSKRYFEELFHISTSILKKSK